MKCDNCTEEIDDYYYTISGFVIVACSISCMAEFLCKNNVSSLKTRLDAVEKHVVKFRAV